MLLVLLLIIPLIGTILVSTNSEPSFVSHKSAISYLNQDLKKEREILYYPRMKSKKINYCTTRCFSTSTVKLVNSESDTSNNSNLLVQVSSVEQLISERCSEGESTISHYNLTESQKTEYESMQDRLDKKVEKIAKEAESLDYTDPNSVNREQELCDKLNTKYDNFIGRVDRLTEDAAPLVGDSLNGTPVSLDSSISDDQSSNNSESGNMSEENLDLDSDSESNKDTEAENTTGIADSTNSKRKREVSEEPNEQVGDSSAPSKRLNLVQEEKGITKDSTSSTSPQEENSKSKSLLDDFADTSTEFPDYFGGDD